MVIQSSHALLFGSVLSFLITIQSHAQISCDEFTINHEVNSHELLLWLDTDLPDTCTVMVSVDRDYWQEGIDDVYTESYFSGRFTVGEWHDIHKIDIRDGVWRKAIDKRINIMKRLDEPFDIKEISDNISIRFVIPVNQQDTRFGRRNELLKGSKVSTSDTGLRIIESSLTFAKPFKSSKKRTTRPYRKIGRLQDISYAGVPRFKGQIEIPLGNTRLEIEAILRQAIKEMIGLANRKPKAIVVFAYMPGDDMDSAYTVGKIEYAPNGEWGEAATNAPMKFKSSIGSTYFEVSRIISLYPPGTTTELISSNDEMIRIWDMGRVGTNRKIVTQAPSGARVEILDSDIWAATPDVFGVWFQVRLNHDGEKAIGWISSDDLK